MDTNSEARCTERSVSRPADRGIRIWLSPEKTPVASNSTPWARTTRPTDQLAISPGDTSFDIAKGPSCSPTILTITRPDGTGEHTMTIDRIVEGVDIGLWRVGTETVDYATGTGGWRIAKVSYAGATTALNHPVDYRLRRASTVSLQVTAATLPTQPRAGGVVRYWTYQGVQTPSPGRTVVIRTPDTTVNGRDWFPGKALATTTTDSTGHYSVTVPIGSTQHVAADVPGTTTDQHIRFGTW